MLQLTQWLLKSWIFCSEGNLPYMEMLYECEYIIYTHNRSWTLGGFNKEIKPHKHDVFVLWPVLWFY